MLLPAVAAGQDGVFTRRQAREAGATAYLVRRRLAEHVWVEVLPETFVLAGVPVSPRVRVRAASLATGATISHGAAAELHGLGLPWDGTLDVITDRRVHLEVVGVRDHRVRLADAERTEIDGIATTTRTRTLLDLLAASPRGQAERLLFRAVQQEWLTAATLRTAVVERARTVGNRQLRELAALLGTGAHSVAERTLHDILAGIRGLRWTANAPLRIDGTTVVVDVLVAASKLAIEVDGRTYHSDADTFQRDRHRQNLLTNAGYAVLRFTWLDLTRRPEMVRRTIEHAAR